MVICLERGADLHMAQLVPLPLTVSCFSNIQIGFTFLVPAHLGSPGKKPLNGKRYTNLRLLYLLTYDFRYNRPDKNRRRLLQYLLTTERSATPELLLLLLHTMLHLFPSHLTSFINQISFTLIPI